MSCKVQCLMSYNGIRPVDCETHVYWLWIAHLFKQRLMSCFVQPPGQLSKFKTGLAGMLLSSSHHYKTTQVISRCVTSWLIGDCNVIIQSLLQFQTIISPIPPLVISRSGFLNKQLMCVIRLRMTHNDRLQLQQLGVCVCALTFVWMHT